MKKIKYIDNAIVRLCGAIIQGENIMPEPYICAIKQAEEQVGENYADTEQDAKQRLVRAVKLNLINRRQYSFEYLKIKYDLPLDKNAFSREKYKFCDNIFNRLRN